MNTKKLNIDWLGNCPKCERSTVTVSTIKGSLEKLFDGDKVECWCGQTGEIDTGDNIAWIEWEKVVLSNKDYHDAYYREKYPDYWNLLPACNHQAWTHYEVSLNSWLVALHRNQEKLEGCVVVPKDQIETWWQDAEEPENFATTIESIPTLGENLGEKEIMEIDEHHTIHLPSKRVYGTWVEKDGDRSFVTGSLEECRAAVEAARGGNEH